MKIKVRFLDDEPAPRKKRAPARKKREVAYPVNPKPNYNLFFLGVGVVVIALVSTGVSVMIYHNSGDIYLDRSRPGFLPDEEEVENQPVEDYKLEDSGPLTKGVLEEYVLEYRDVLTDLDRLEKPYAADALTDRALGIEAAGEDLEKKEE